MSIIIQIGQCGNQIGEQVFHKLFTQFIQTKNQDLKNHFFHETQRDSNSKFYIFLFLPYIFFF
jgi:hypothetical protein